MEGLELHKNKSFLVVPKAIVNFFVYNIAPEVYLQSNRNIYDYCGGARVVGDWKFMGTCVVKSIPEEFLRYTTLQKEQYVIDNGWEKYYNGWIRKAWILENKPYDRMATSLDDAFQSVVPKEATIEESQLQKVTRYYISNKGCKIVKVNKSDNRRINVVAGQWLQTELNRVDITTPWEEYDLDERFYLEQIYKEIALVSKTKNKQQLTLFD